MLAFVRGVSTLGISRSYFQAWQLWPRAVRTQYSARYALLPAKKCMLCTHYCMMIPLRYVSPFEIDRRGISAADGHAHALARLWAITAQEQRREGRGAAPGSATTRTSTTVPSAPGGSRRR